MSIVAHDAHTTRTVGLDRAVSIHGDLLRLERDVLQVLLTFVIRSRLAVDPVAVRAVVLAGLEELEEVQAVRQRAAVVYLTEVERGSGPVEQSLVLVDGEAELVAEAGVAYRGCVAVRRCHRGRDMGGDRVVVVARQDDGGRHDVRELVYVEGDGGTALRRICGVRVAVAVARAALAVLVPAVVGIDAADEGEQGGEGEECGQGGGVGLGHVISGQVVWLLVGNNEGISCANRSPKMAFCQWCG